MQDHVEIPLGHQPLKSLDEMSIPASLPCPSRKIQLTSQGIGTNFILMRRISVQCQKIPRPGICSDSCTEIV